MIRQLLLRQFRCYSKAEIADLGRFNVFAGPNFSGKSTILDAISVGLTGTCRGAETGRSLGELRRRGSKNRWAVGVVLDEGESFSRSEGEGPRAGVQAEIERAIGAPAAQIRACLYSGELMRLDPKARQKLVLDLAQPSAVPVPDELRAMLEGEPETLTLAEIEASYQQAYEARREIGSELKALGDLAPPAIPEGWEDRLKGRSFEEVANAQRETSERIRTLRMEADVLTNKVHEITRSGDERDELEERIEDAKAQVANFDAEAHAQAEAEIGKQIDEQTERRNALATSYRNLTSQRSEAAGERKVVIGALEDLKQQGATCSTCGTKLTKPKLEKREAELRHQAEVYSKTIAKLDEQIAQAKDEGVGLDEDLGKLKEAAFALEREKSDFDATKAKVAKLEQKLAGLSDATGDADKLTEELQQLERRIRKGEEVERVLSTYLGALRHHALAIVAKEELEAEHASLDALVNALGPKGLQAQAGESDDLAAFVGTVEHQLKGMGMPCDLGPMLQVQDDPYVRDLPARLLSTSERMLFGLAFQVAVAKASGVNIVAVDDFEHMDPATSNEARKILEASGCQVFLFQVMRDESKFVQHAERANQSDDRRFYLIHRDGTVSLPGREAA